LLVVAIFTVHLPYGFSSIRLMAVTAGRAQFAPPGYECDLLYLTSLAALVLGGSGPLSLTRRREELCTLAHDAPAYVPPAGLRFLANLVTNDTKSPR
jgi:hypothetical protein